MIKKMAEQITKFICKDLEIQQNIQEIYQYGIELTLSTILNIFWIVLTSAVLSDIFSGLIFLGVFMIIKPFAGGYHAKTYFMCNAMFILTFLLVWIAGRGVAAIPDIKLAYRVLEAIVLLGLIPIIIFSPIENENKSLDKNKRKRYRIASIAIYIIAALLALIIQFINIKYGAMITLSLSAVSIMMIIEILKRRR